MAWLALGLGATRLIALADSLSAACPSDINAGGRPKRTRAAHVTVSRRADASLIGALRTQALGEFRADWTIESIALLRSHLGPDGARYETLHELAL